MNALEYWEMAAYIVEVIAVPVGISVFLLDQKKERQNEEEELYQRLSDEYADFSKLLLENVDLRLMSTESGEIVLTSQQRERKKIIFDILISLFERAYILVYEDKMSKHTQRLWASWDDYIHFWCGRKDFREALPELLTGEDPDFGQYIRKTLNEIQQNGGKYGKRATQLA